MPQEIFEFNHGQQKFPSVHKDDNSDLRKEAIERLRGLTDANAQDAQKNTQPEEEKEQHS